MVFVEHYQTRLARARLLCDKKLYPQAYEMTTCLHGETKSLSKHYDELPGFLLLARQLSDVAIQAQVLLLFIEQRMAGDKQG